MKKRILSIMLVLTFIFCAIPAGVNAATGDGGEIADWTAKVGSIEALDGGVFSIKAFDESKPASLTNKKQVRQIMYNGEYTAATISITFDTASLAAGRADGKSGANDTGIVFGGSGVKASSKTTVNDIEKDSSYYALMFSNDSLRIALVDKAWKGNVTTYPEAKDINVSVNLKTELGAAWDGIKQNGKVTLTVEYTKTGAVKVYVQGNHVKKLDRAEGVCVPFGGEFGVRVGNGFHVPTKIYDFEAIPAEDNTDDGNTEGEGGNTEGGNTENENTGNENENTGNTPEDDTDDSLAPNVGGNTANDNAPAGGEADAQPEEDNNSMWIIIASAAAGLIIIGVVLAIVLGKKKKA